MKNLAKIQSYQKDIALLTEMVKLHDVVIENGIGSRISRKRLN